MMKKLLMSALALVLVLSATAAFAGSADSSPASPEYEVITFSNMRDQCIFNIEVTSSKGTEKFKVPAGSVRTRRWYYPGLHSDIDQQVRVVVTDSLSGEVVGEAMLSYKAETRTFSAVSVSDNVAFFLNAEEACLIVR